MTEAYLVESLRSHGLKVTPQRHLICRLIAATEGEHPTAERLYDEAARVMPTLSLKTVYTTIGELAQIGVVRLARFGTENLRVDTVMGPHAHAVCEACGRLSDVPIVGEALNLLRSLVPEGAFHIDGFEVVYRGRCPECMPRATVCANTVQKGGERDGTE